MTKPILFSMANSTKMPPCGARDVAPNAIDKPPVTAPPIIIDGITRSGSAAANGMAPSEMNEAPSSQAARPFSRSGSLNSLGRNTVASAIASGGTMPADITAAMISNDAVVEAASPAVANA